MQTSGIAPLPLSAVLITRDAAQQLGAALAGLTFCTEIVIVDSGSQDETVAIARRHGARVIETHWRGFGAQKRFAVEQARHDWVLCLDADERVSEELARSIVAALSQPGYAGWRCARRNRFMGRWLRHGEGYPDWCLRLFDRRRAQWSLDAVHEKVIAHGPVGTLRGDLLHESAETVESYLAKQNRYSTLAAEALLAAGCRAHAWQVVLSPLIRFIKFYFLRLGLLDGLPGFVHIVIGCGASFAKYAKMRAKQEGNG